MEIQLFYALLIITVLLDLLRHCLVQINNTLQQVALLVLPVLQEVFALSNKSTSTQFPVPMPHFISQMEVSRVFVYLPLLDITKHLILSWPLVLMDFGELKGKLIA